MRLDINLATRPYEDARRILGALGLRRGRCWRVLTLFLLGWTVRELDQCRKRSPGASRELQQQIAERDQERAQAQAFLDMAANRSTRDQSQFLNGLIQRKAFSWTRVFEDLEQVMPPNLHVVSLRPELNEQNQMELDMKVAGDTRAAAVELVHRMEGSKHFQGAQLVQEMGSEKRSGRGRLDGISIYVPDRDRGERQSNAGPGEFAAQVEDCDWGDAGRRCRGGGGSVLAAGRFGGFAAGCKLIELKAELQKKTREVEPLRGMDKKIVLAKGQIGGFLQGPLCRQGFRSARRTGQSSRRRTASACSRRITRRRMRRLPAWFRLKSREVFPETTCNWCDSSMRWSGRRCSLKWTAWAWPAKARGRSSWKSVCTVICGRVPK